MKTLYVSTQKLKRIIIWKKWKKIRPQFSSVQFSRSFVSDSLRPRESQHARPPCPSPTPGVHSNSCPSKSVMPSYHLILCHPLLLLCSIFPNIRVFSNELVLCIKWPKYWSFSFSISPSSEYSGLVYFRMDWFDLLAVQRTLKRLVDLEAQYQIFCRPCSHSYQTWSSDELESLVPI